MRKVLTVLAVVVLSMALSLNAFAVGFVGSATAEQAPTIVGGETTDGDSEGGSGLVVVPVAGADESDLTEEQKEELKSAYDQLSKGEMTYPEEVGKTLGDNAAVKDLFYLDGELTEGETTEVTLDAGVAAGEKVVVAVLVDGEWVTVPAVNNGDGTITLTLDTLGTIAIFVEGEEPKAEEPVVEEPTVEEPAGTEEAEGGFPVVPVVGGVGILAIIFWLLAKRKKEDKE